MKISILIPCFNEEKTISVCLQSCLNQSRKADEIIVVDDGSKDNTLQVLRSYKDQIKIVKLPKNKGNKSYAQEIGIHFVSGEVCIMVDADSILENNFIERIEANFLDKSVDAVCGYVKSIPMNWLTGLRQLEYLFAQDLQKKAQNVIGAIYVIPGCAAAFRMSTFLNKVEFNHDTVTEDLDFTYQHHEKGGKIIYDDKAVVYTLDPTKLGDYINQLRRWYRGGWQNLNKHKDKPFSLARGAEMTILFSEGIAYPLLAIILSILYPSYLNYYIVLFLVFSLSLGVYGAIKLKRIELLYYSPLYFTTYIINSYVFIEQFIKTFILKTSSTWFRPVRNI